MALTSPPDLTAELAAAVEAARLEHDIARARLHRVAAAAFENEERACRTLDRLLSAGGVERAIAAMSGDLQQLHFGIQRRPFLGFFASRDPDVRRALADLPEVIREASAAEARLRDALAVQRQRAMATGRSDDDEPARTHMRTARRSRA